MVILAVVSYLLAIFGAIAFYLIFCFKMAAHAEENPNLSDREKTLWKAWIYYGGFLFYAVFVARDSFIRGMVIIFVVYGTAVIGLYYPVSIVMEKEIARLHAEIKNPKWLKDQVRFSIRARAQSVSTGTPVRIEWLVIVRIKSIEKPQISFEGFKQEPSFSGLKYEEAVTDTSSEEEMHIAGSSFKKKTVKIFTVTSEKAGKFKINGGIMRLRLTYPATGESFPMELSTKPLTIEFHK